MHIVKYLGQNINMDYDLPIHVAGPDPDSQLGMSHHTPRNTGITYTLSVFCREMLCVLCSFFCRVVLLTAEWCMVTWGELNLLEEKRVWTILCILCVYVIPPAETKPPDSSGLLTK